MSTDDQRIWVLTLQSKNAHKRVIITREPKVGCLIEKDSLL